MFPPHLGYGEQSVLGIPANAKITFEVELLVSSQTVRPNFLMQLARGR
jgi:hypothetical protein